jgi:uncharacterized protein DUF4861
MIAAILVAQTLLSAPQLRVVVHNNLNIARPSETVEVPSSSLTAFKDLSRVHVVDSAGHEVLAQVLPDALIFQTDMPANGEKTFDLRAGDVRKYRKEDFRVYGRFVRERFDDFAWENDRVAHRMYGAALETWEKEPLTSSAVDVWLKKTRRLVINDWYMVDDYHHDNGEGGDFYSAGSSRGCGGTGLWRDGHLVVSKNFRNSRVIAAGPIRLVFELEYPNFETKRITLDAGQNFGKFESRYVDPVSTYAAGIKKFASTDLRVEREAGWIRAWGPVVGGTGHFACTLVFDPSSISDVTEGDGNHLVIAKTPAVYYVGTAWDQGGDFATVADWDRYVEQWTRRVKSPLSVKVTAP